MERRNSRFQGRLKKVDGSKRRKEVGTDETQGILGPGNTHRGASGNQRCRGSAAASGRGSAGRAAAVCQHHLRRQHGFAAQQARRDLGMVRSGRPCEGGDRRAHRNRGGGRRPPLAGEDRSSGCGRPVHDDHHRRPDRGVAQRAGGRYLAVRRPIQHAVCSPPGPDRSGGRKGRGPPADPLLHGGPALGLSPGEHRLRLLERGDAGNRGPRLRGGVLLRPPRAAGDAHSHRSDRRRRRRHSG